MATKKDGKRQTVQDENCSPWKGEEIHWLVSMWGDGTSIQTKLQGMYGNKYRCLLQ